VVGVNVALATVIAAAGTTDPPTHRPGSRPAEADLRRLVAKAVGRVTVGPLPAGATELGPLLPSRSARLLTAHLRLVVGIARGRGWDVRSPGVQTLVRLALAQTSPSEAAGLLGLASGSDLSPPTLARVSTSHLWSVNRHATYVLLRVYGSAPPTLPTTTLAVAVAALELFSRPADQNTAQVDQFLR
jgi:hypothetical protein